MLQALVPRIGVPSIHARVMTAAVLSRALAQSGSGPHHIAIARALVVLGARELATPVNTEGEGTPTVAAMLESRLARIAEMHSSGFPTVVVAAILQNMLTHLRVDAVVWHEKPLPPPALVLVEAFVLLSSMRANLAEPVLQTLLKRHANAPFEYAPTSFCLHQFIVILVK